MNAATVITINSSQYSRQRLTILMLVSIAIHSSVLLLDPGPDTLPEPGSARDQTLQIQLTTNNQASTPDHAGKKAQGKALDAPQLIEHSPDYIRSQVMEKSDRPPYQIFGNPVRNSHLTTLLTTRKKQAPIATYRVFDGGNLRVKMASLFGGFQCFEILPPDPLDTFSSGVWLLIRC